MIKKNHFLLICTSILLMSHDLITLDNYNTKDYKKCNHLNEIKKGLYIQPLCIMYIIYIDTLQKYT